MHINQTRQRIIRSLSKNNLKIWKNYWSRSGKCRLSCLRFSTRSRYVFENHVMFLIKELLSLSLYFIVRLKNTVPTVSMIPYSSEGYSIKFNSQSERKFLYKRVLSHWVGMLSFPGQSQQREIYEIAVSLILCGSRVLYTCSTEFKAENLHSSIFWPGRSAIFWT